MPATNPSLLFVCLSGGGLLANALSGYAGQTLPAFSVTGFSIQASQTITFAALGNVTLGVAPFTISATASSGLVVSFASTTGVCTVSGATVTLVALGTCTIQATQAGNKNYSAATPVYQSFQVTQGSLCDVQHNGDINVADVQLIINEALGVTPAVNDLNGDRVVNVSDVQIEINAALGLGCAAN